MEKHNAEQGLMPVLKDEVSVYGYTELSSPKRCSIVVSQEFGGLLGLQGITRHVITRY